MKKTQAIPEEETPIPLSQGSRINLPFLLSTKSAHGLNAPYEPPRVFLHLENDDSESSSTRYLDRVVFDVNDSTIVRDCAVKFGITPRDLEIMVFFVYSGFDLEIAKNPRSSENGEELIANVTTHLTGSDAEKILEASYIIYTLRTNPQHENASELSKYLWSIVSNLDQNASYTLKFYNESRRLKELTTKVNK